MKLLAGDIGGTKTLLRCANDDGTVVHEERYESPAWQTFDDLLRAFLEALGHDVAIGASCFAVAGAVLDARAEVTNVGWVLEETSLSRAFPIGRVSLINDFYAIGLGVPLLGPDDVLSLQQGTRDRNAPIAILGAGTGLANPLVMKIAGVHTSAGRGRARRLRAAGRGAGRSLLHCNRRYGHVSSERVISGMVLVNIFTYLGGDDATAAEIADRADAGDALAKRTFAIFVDAYGAEAGDLALRTLARGGVYLAGGVAAKNAGRFTDGAFLAAFTRKGRFSHVMKTIPVDLIMNEQVGLIGAVEGARRTMNDER